MVSVGTVARLLVARLTLVLRFRCCNATVDAGGNMSEVEVNGVSLAYDDTGSGDPTMVWIHGAAGHRACWHRFQRPQR